ncbi:hypothetical protein [Maribacter arcticus]|uniref:Uncharacterized protein n=1 Tax=Maribacter arcticus TaxID=561365 RepID=A0A1T5ED27_9FLAO|nr:hypothetical protein [Maribacter arcticus]SKB81625.1 hypothetical protein SAMN05660866_03419 [Maribacter arcticus]
MELNRYETVKSVINKLDKIISKFLNEAKPNLKELFSLIEMRSTYVKELDGLTRSKNTHEMFKNKNRYGK